MGNLTSKPQAQMDPINYIQSAEVDPEGNLTFKTNNDETIGPFNVKGPVGSQGQSGKDGLSITGPSGKDGKDGVISAVNDVDFTVGKDFIQSGENSWLMRSPDDGSDFLGFVPGKNGGGWNMDAQTKFNSDGTVVFANDVSIPVGKNIRVGGTLIKGNTINVSAESNTVIMSTSGSFQFFISWNSGAGYASGFATSSNSTTLIAYSSNSSGGDSSIDTKDNWYSNDGKGIAIFFAGKDLVLQTKINYKGGAITTTLIGA